MRLRLLLGVLSAKVDTGIILTGCSESRMFLDTALLSEWAQDLGLRRAEFEACQASRSVRGLVDASISESLRLGIDSIPYFQINESESLQGVQNLTTFRAIVDNIINQS